MLKVTEIYKSIQGESTYAGLPCIFIRLTGCNLRCGWCDTDYSFYGGSQMSVDEILTEVEKLECKLVEVTGGEPLIQNETPELVQRLLDSGCTVLVETGGAIDISMISDKAIRVMDVKCPGSDMSDKMNFDNFSKLNSNDEIKFVIMDRTDFDWATKVIQDYKLEAVAKILFSPVFGALKPDVLAQWILDSGLEVRMQMQMHKLIWAPDVKGV